MLDLRLIRERPDEVQRALAQKGGAELIPEILARDVERRRLLKEVEDLKAQRNIASEAIGRAKRAGQDAGVELAIGVVEMVLPALIDHLVGGQAGVGARHKLERRPVIQRP